MSVFDGDMELQSVYMVDYVQKNKPKSPRRKAVDDDCLIVGLSRDSLKARDQPRTSPDLLCPVNYEYYKEAVERFGVNHPKLTSKYMSKDIDPLPIDHEIQDLKRTEYLTKYCPRDLPFMSVSLSRRARALHAPRLPDDARVPDTSHGASYRRPAADRYAEPPTAMSMKPKFDDSLQRELRGILRVRTGDTSYGAAHAQLARVVLRAQPFGPARAEPARARWRDPYDYTYRI